LALRHRLIGRAARLWWRLRRPRTLGVRAIAVDHLERIALVRHTYTGGWYLPGGGVARGESCEAAALRELHEEVGLAEARIERVLGVYHSRAEAKDDHVVVFVVRVGPAAIRAADPREIEEAGWFGLDALPDGVSPATLRRIAEFRAGRTGMGSW
jgi:ADP-ribose pyrophosphatase YjhB (NUDIX family)